MLSAKPASRAGSRASLLSHPAAASAAASRSHPHPHRQQRQPSPGILRAAASSSPTASSRGSGRSGNGNGGLTYKDSGVDIDAASELVRRIQKLCPEVGGFGGLFPIGDDRYLVSGTDGVGTKLRLAFDMDEHGTIGTDLVAMSVNDIITLGATPLFFLDYFATGSLDVDRAEQVVKGIVDGCRESGCVLLGGETAEMPGFYADGEYDLSGFAVGMVTKGELIDGSRVKPGDALLGLPSSGVHSNGYSLARKVLAVSGLSLDAPFPLNEARSVGSVLPEPTRLYVKQLLALNKEVGVKGAVHVTGGGFYDNIPRALPDGCGAEITRGSWDVLPVFRWMQDVGRISDPEMFRTFNMGVGFICVVDQKDVGAATAVVPEAKVIGRVVKGEGVTFA